MVVEVVAIRSCVMQLLRSFSVLTLLFVGLAGKIATTT